MRDGFGRVRNCGGVHMRACDGSGDDDYTTSGECTINVLESGYIDVDEFETESYFDYMCG